MLHFPEMHLCPNTSTFLTFNHWMEPSVKVLVKKWNETKYLGSIFKETKGKGGTSSRTHYRTHWHNLYQSRLIFIIQSQLLWKFVGKYALLLLTLWSELGAEQINRKKTEALKIIIKYKQLDLKAWWFYQVLNSGASWRWNSMPLKTSASVKN